MATTAKKLSGRNVSESERNTERITIRLDPEDAERLRALAVAWRCPLADVVSGALDEVERRSDEVSVRALIESLYVAREQLPEWARLTVQAAYERVRGDTRRNA